MRTPRLKQLRKLMKRLTKVGFREPYNIMADHRFLVAFNTSQMSLKHIEHVLGGKIKLSTTQCELRKYQAVVADTTLASQVQVKPCSHTSPEYTTCTIDHIYEGNPHHYFLALSPKDRQVKEEKNIPIIFFRAGVLCVEISQASDDQILKQEYSQGISAQEKELLNKLFNTAE